MINVYDFYYSEEAIASKIYKEIFKNHGLKYKDFSLDITMVDTDTIRELNKNTRNIDKATDVLSYPSFDHLLPFDKNNYYSEISPEDNTLYIGEILICREIMVSQAAEYGHSTDRECAFLITHGILHLLGYDHIEENDKLLMRDKEKEILTKCKYVR